MSYMLVSQICPESKTVWSKFRMRNCAISVFSTPERKEDQVSGCTSKRCRHLQTWFRLSSCLDLQRTFRCAGWSEWRLQKRCCSQFFQTSQASQQSAQFSRERCPMKYSKSFSHRGETTWSWEILLCDS